jgi:hypothetical protein
MKKTLLDKTVYGLQNRVESYFKDGKVSADVRVCGNVLFKLKNSSTQFDSIWLDRESMRSMKQLIEKLLGEP